ncbi:MAG: anhydro-N-acetylmuramic acid kinase [Pseudomonadota bacterium]|nr:anhydro-N-acetylmuramic acid kinase [Pseudomonadota bacterium]
MKKNFIALGLMSGTSLDGIDAAILETDGEYFVNPGKFLSLPYNPRFRETIRSVLWENGPIENVENQLTLLHAKAVSSLLEKAELKASDVDIIGFHGHTILHDPDKGRTYQIGDGALLAAKTNIDVVCDLRNNDVANGGQGAPLVPLYHLALAKKMDMPLVILNIGGVANITYLNGNELSLVAFDTGPGNALIDDWVNSKLGKAYDQNGAIASSGKVCQQVLNKYLSSKYFEKLPPKSMDRAEFKLSFLGDLSIEDGAATLTALTYESIKRSVCLLPNRPKRWLVTGGGRHNRFLMEKLSLVLKEKVEPVEVVGWMGDAIEAQAFSYLAVRSKKKLPITFPNTTGVRRPLSGGILYPKQV